MAADPIMSAQPAPLRLEKPLKKKLVRRPDKDFSQQLRLGVQIVFILLNLVIGAQFYLWVRYLESGLAGEPVTRPAGVEGWLPIAALMNLKAWIVTGAIPEVRPAAMFLLVSFLLISLLLKKAFCSWLCPVGSISEALWKLGRKLFRKNFALPKWLDILLRGLKSLLFGFFAMAILKMPAVHIGAFMTSPYGLIADVKMLNFFRFMGTTALVVVGVLVVLSILVRNFWCRYLCPYGALLGIVSLVSPAKITRDADACIDCAKCAKACPYRLPVDVKPAIRSAECTLCMECVAVCPAKGALQVKVTPKRTLSPAFIAAAIAVIFLGIVGAAKVSGHWETYVPNYVIQSLLASADQIGH